MHLLTKQRCWREGKGIEPLHQYCVGFDCMSDAEINELYPEDDVPADFQMREVVVDTSRTELTPEEFHDWLNVPRCASFFLAPRGPIPPHHVTRKLC